jgi:dihydroorotate dehydrogenase subfamily 2
MYKKIIKPILFKFDPETVHNVLVGTGDFLGNHKIGRKTTAMMYGKAPQGCSKTVDGITYKTPLILSAGFDYNARLSRILPSIGFGGEEAGSVTALPCKGNQKPRLTRLPDDKSIIVNKGLANDGVEAIINRLKQTPREKDFVIGVSIARTNSPGTASIEKGIEDYAISLTSLVEENIGDYYTINISCPNAHGGEAFTTPELAEKLFTALDSIPHNKPRYVKMPISLEWDQVEEILVVLEKHAIDGVIIGNLNKHYNELKNPEDQKRSYQGGLSGLPTVKRSNKYIYKTKKLYGDRFTITGCGGIFSPDDAVEKLKLGADLLQLITGMIYEGPGLINRINKHLVDDYFPRAL